jgi:beta-lactamase class A
MRRGIGRREASSLGVGAMMVSVLPHGTAVAQTGVEQAVAAIESRLSARVGVSVIDTANGREWAHKGSERFPLTSTFKAFACAAALKRVDAGSERLDRMIPVRAADLVTYSPVVEKHVAAGAMSLADLCVAATALSDNAAGNLVLDSIGGPAGLTAFMRSIGDSETRLD